MAAPLPDGPDAVRAILPLTEAAEARLSAYVDLIRRWQPVKNLVAPSTLGDIWRRHMADGAQALAALPSARRWIDLGSGAGIPGLVTAILLADEPGARVTLVESNSRKAAFLLTVARELKLPVRVLNERIEQVSAPSGGEIGPVEAVSARALSPLSKLLEQAEPWLTQGAVGVFHKGQDFASERDTATLSWEFDLVEHPSRIEPDSRIAVIRGLARRRAAG